MIGERSVLVMSQLGGWTLLDWLHWLWGDAVRDDAWFAPRASNDR